MAAPPPVRFACASVPLFPLAARLRSEPALREQAVALFEGNGNAARLVAATRLARRAGLVPGLTPPEARAILPNVLVRARDRESERAAQEALLDTAGLFSPRVEETGEGLVTLDMAGLERLRFSDGMPATESANSTADSVSMWPRVITVRLLPASS